jgi:hypothetical protein
VTARAWSLVCRRQSGTSAQSSVANASVAMFGQLISLALSGPPLDRYHLVIQNFRATGQHLFQTGQSKPSAASHWSKTKLNRIASVARTHFAFCRRLDDHQRRHAPRPEAPAVLHGAAAPRALRFGRGLVGRASLRLQRRRDARTAARSLSRAQKGRQRARSGADPAHAAPRAGSQRCDVRGES